MRLINSFTDDQYPKAVVYNPRISARAVVINAAGEIALTHLLATDKFGKRDYYELPGGGKKLGETILQSAMREMKEELGVEVALIAKLGVIHDFYNLINQENYSYYYLFKVIKEGTNHFEDRERGLIDKIVWVPLEDAIRLLRKQLEITGVGLLVARRELPIVELAANIVDKGTLTK